MGIFYRRFLGTSFWLSLFVTTACTKIENSMPSQPAAQNAVPSWIVNSENLLLGNGLTNPETGIRQNFTDAAATTAVPWNNADGSLKAIVLVPLSTSARKIATTSARTTVIIPASILPPNSTFPTLQNQLAAGELTIQGRNRSLNENVVLMAEAVVPRRTQETPALAVPTPNPKLENEEICCQGLDGKFFLAKRWECRGIPGVEKGDHVCTEQLSSVYCKKPNGSIIPSLRQDCGPDSIIIEGSVCCKTEEGKPGSLLSAEGCRRALGKPTEDPKACEIACCINFRGHELGQASECARTDAFSKCNTVCCRTKDSVRPMAAGDCPDGNRAPAESCFLGERVCCAYNYGDGTIGEFRWSSGYECTHVGAFTIGPDSACEPTCCKTLGGKEIKRIANCPVEDRLSPEACAPKQLKCCQKDGTSQFQSEEECSKISGSVVTPDFCTTSLENICCEYGRGSWNIHPAVMPRQSCTRGEIKNEYCQKDLRCCHKDGRPQIMTKEECHEEENRAGVPFSDCETWIPSPTPTPPPIRELCCESEDGRYFRTRGFQCSHNEAPLSVCKDKEVKVCCEITTTKSDGNDLNLSPQDPDAGLFGRMTPRQAPGTTTISSIPMDRGSCQIQMGKEVAQEKCDGRCRVKSDCKDPATPYCNNGQCETQICGKHATKCCSSADPTIHDTNCESGLYCRGDNLCVKPGILGEACDILEKSCEDGLSCSCFGSSALCGGNTMSGKVGMPCRYSTCDDGLYCDGQGASASNSAICSSTGMCRPLKAPGMPCARDEECANGSCDASQGGTCHRDVTLPPSMSPTPIVPTPPPPGPMPMPPR